MTKKIIKIGAFIIFLSLVGLFFPYNAKASIYMPKYSSVLGNMDYQNYRATCTGQLVIFTTDNTGTFFNEVKDCNEGELDISYTIDAYTPMILTMLECSGNCETYETIQEVVNSGYLTDRKTYTVYAPVTKGILFGFTKDDGVPTSDPTDLLASVGTVSNDVFSGSMPYMILFMGVGLTFFIIYNLKSTVVPKETKKDRIIRDKDGKQIGIDVSGDGYKRIVNKKGQEIGVIKE